ncbi:MAG TPA: YraN family protein [Noviherbaspirillum sp.]|nr:YraN family protein [Noviherbaspirillum sp.]
MALLNALIRPRTAKQVDGDAAEDRALHYLQQQGLKLVERNFRCKGGEIDIIMQDRGALVFVEVRKRANGRYGGAAASVTAGKQARLVVAAQTYLQRLREQPVCRFDIVAIENGTLEWLKNAIEA